MVEDLITQTLINILKKHIPKKIAYKKTSYGTPWICPACGADQAEVEFYGDFCKMITYCWCCGQRLDWQGAKEQSGGKTNED